MGVATYLKGLKKQDEWYTPKEAVIPLLKHVPKEWTIWCPFDKESSEFVQVFRGGGHKVICSHIEDGKDFFTYEPDEHYDCIISNPPYSKKDAIYERLFQIGKPWAMLVSMNGVFDSAKRYGLFSKFGVQFFIMQGRIKFFNAEFKDKVAPPFQTIYVCWNLLPETIMFQQDDTGLFKE